MSTTKITAQKVSQMFFFVVILFMMYTSMQLYITWFLPQSFLAFVSFVGLIFYLQYNKLYVTKKRLFSAILISFALLYEGVKIYPVSFISWIQLLSRILLVSVLIFSQFYFLCRALKLIIRVTAILMLVSLIFWVIYLIGIPLPHYSVVTNNYYDHSVYYFFLLNNGSIIPRFAGLFLEPGHVGSTACLLFFLNGVTLKRWENVVFLIAIFLSLSLAAYGLLVGCIGLHLLIKSKKACLKLVPYLVVLLLTTIFFSNYNDGDNPVNEKILMRLVFEDGEMAGNNRTSQAFDYAYDRYLKSDRVFTGMGRDVMVTGSKVGVLHGTASWKKYFFLRGYVGCALLLAFLFYYLYSYPTKRGFAFLIIYLVCNMIRDYPLDELWLYLMVISLPILYENEKYITN